MTEPFLDTSWHRVAKLRPQLRAHTQVHRHRYQGVPWYVIQDSVSGRFHRFTPAVYLFIGQMDGRRTVQEIWSSTVERLGDDAPTQTEVINLLSSLHAADLLKADVAPDAAEIFERAQRFSGAKLRNRLGNPLALRIPLLDPDHFLDQTVGFINLLSGRMGAFLWLIAIVPALTIVAVNWPELSENLTDRTLALENLALMALVFPVLKIFHEFGHAYATKSAGGQVHELGIMLLVFAPVPYVDASASTGFRDKWRRSFIGAAGMIVELFIAALATFVWASVEPGVVRSVAFQIMLIAGVSTVVFNANPLLRFDGYYILCDLLEIPNLGTRSARFWGWLAGHYLFGVKEQPPHATTEERFWFLLYAPLALLYRILVLFGISIFVASSFFFIGVVIALWGLFASLFLPLVKAVAHIVTGQRFRARRARAVTTLFGMMAALAFLVLVVPMPLHTHAEGVVWLPDESIVRAGSDGFVSVVSRHPGEVVNRGDVLIQTEDPVITADVGVLQSQVNALQARLLSEQFNDRVQADVTRQELDVKRDYLAQAQDRARLLNVESNTDGTFIAPNYQDLPGRYFKRGDVMAYVVSSSARVIRVVVTQADIDLVRNRLRGVEFKLTNDLGRTYSARVLREVPAASDRLPSKALAETGGGQFASDPRDPNQMRTLQRTFQFDLEFPAVMVRSNYGTRVFVRFDHGFEPLGWQLYRRLRQLFLSRFDE